MDRSVSSEGGYLLPRWDLVAASSRGKYVSLHSTKDGREELTPQASQGMALWPNLGKETSLLRGGTCTCLHSASVHMYNSQQSQQIL